MEEQLFETAKNKPYLEYLYSLQPVFLGNIHHELRTPISIILGYADLLREGELGALAAEQQQAIYAIANSAHELKELVDQVTTLLAADAEMIFSSPLKLIQLADAAVAAYCPKAKSGGVSLEFQPASDLPDVTGDPGQLFQAISCLVENAIKFTPKGGQVEVRLAEEAGWVTLIVADTGIGMRPEELDNIFTPFYQVDDSPTRRYGGLGLGLCVAKAVIEVHAGIIEVTSQLGQGSQFTIKLPAATGMVQLEQPVEPKAALRRILLVDDEIHITLMLKEALAEIPNCEIRMASNSEQALQLFEAQAFDLVITDYRMPGVDGLTLATYIRQRYPQTAIIILSAYSSAALFKRASELQIQHILHKPVKLLEIRQLVSQTLNHREI